MANKLKAYYQLNNLFDKSQKIFQKNGFIDCKSQCDRLYKNYKR